MWGEYATEEGTTGAIDITFGYSKQKRFDKKQIKFSLGTTQGICIDGQVLSGNTDDKTFNVDNLDRAVELRKRFESNNEEFFYIADSAAFTKEFLDKSALLGVDVITRMPDNIKETKEAIHYAWEHIGELEKVEIPTSTTPSVYHVHESECVYQGIPLKMAVCYSEKLKPQKKKTVEKRVAKEAKDVEKLIKSFKDRSFACEEDALLEIAKLTKQSIEKLNYHNVEISIDREVTRRRGRPSQDVSKDITGITYILNFSVVRDENSIREILEKECLFVVVSTKMNMKAIEILMEYKTQSAVERKFQFLKSPQFVSSFFLDSPKRVEALGYLLLILMLLLSVAEYVVRRELAKDKVMIIGPGKVKMTRPSMIAIYRIFYSVVTSTVTINGVIHRGYNKPLADNIQIVMKHLGIPQDIFIRGSA
jgi:transposase